MEVCDQVQKEWVWCHGDADDEEDIISPVEYAGGRLLLTFGTETWNVWVELKRAFLKIKSMIRRNRERFVMEE